MLNKEYITV